MNAMMGAKGKIRTAIAFDLPGQQFCGGRQLQIPWDPY
jgi:hypothetical protein